MANVDDLNEGVAELELGVWTSDELDKLEELSLCTVKEGNAIYPLWKDLLRHWFSRKNCEVYIVTPFMDPERLQDICSLMIEHSATAKLKLLFVRDQCHREFKIEKSIEWVKRKAIGKFSKPEDKKFIEEEKVFPNIKILKESIPKDYFHAKFIGSVIGEKAEVLVTSANFQGAHFNIPNLETVFYQDMTKQEFLDGMLKPFKKMANLPDTFFD